MGLHLPPKASLAGVSVRAIKKAAARGYTHADDQPAYHALCAQGWAWRNEDGNIVTSPEGAALGMAHLRNRMPLAKADEAYAVLRTGIDALVAEGLVTAEVWLFGSYMRREAFVGDIDVGVGLSYVGSYRDFYAACAERYGHTPWHQACVRNRDRWLLTTYASRVVFGDRRPSVFDGVEFDLSQADAGMPVQCVYTPAQGWNAGPVLAHHPDARGPLAPRTPITITLDQGTFTNTNTA